MIHLHWDELMATRFEIRIDASAAEAPRIRSVAEEVFASLHRLESLLSRFISESDISRINRLAAGESMVIPPETFRCLNIAQSVRKTTQGRFDVAFRSVAAGNNRAFELLRHPCRIRACRDHLDLDLGGIGKGYALDFGAAQLVAYDYPRAMLSADRSTILAMDPPQGKSGWQVEISTAGIFQPLPICRCAVSCSGDSVRGRHIVDPREPSRVISGPRTISGSRVTVRAETAALADAYSTAAFCVDSDAILDFSRQTGCAIWS